MPSSGPHASLLLDKKETKIPVMDVSSALADQLYREILQEQVRELDSVTASLSQPVEEHIKIFPGDILRVSLWAQDNSTQTGTPGVPVRKDLGKYAVDYSGNVDLPYIGRISLRGKTQNEAERTLTSRYNAAHLFPNIMVSIEVVENHKQNIVVMGAVNQPTVVNWSEGGIDLTEAVAHAGGFKVFDPSVQGSDLAVNNVLVIRNWASYNVPMQTALSEKLPLWPGDRVVLQHKPVYAPCVWVESGRRQRWCRSIWHRLWRRFWLRGEI